MSNSSSSAFLIAFSKRIGSLEELVTEVLKIDSGTVDEHISYLWNNGIKDGPICDKLSNLQAKLSSEFLGEFSEYSLSYTDPRRLRYSNATNDLGGYGNAARDLAKCLDFFGVKADEIGSLGEVDRTLATLAFFDQSIRYIDAVTAAEDIVDEIAKEATESSTKQAYNKCAAIAKETGEVFLYTVECHDDNPIGSLLEQWGGPMEALALTKFSHH